MHAKLLQSCPTLWNPVDCNLQPTRLLCPWDSPGKNTEVLLCPPPGDLPNPGIKPTSLTSPALAGGFFTTSTTWEAPGYPCSDRPRPLGRPTRRHEESSALSKAKHLLTWMKTSLLLQRRLPASKARMVQAEHLPHFQVLVILSRVSVEKINGGTSLVV